MACPPPPDQIWIIIYLGICRLKFAVFNDFKKIT